VEDLEGKVALVTGASRGVGAATAYALAEAGCDVACAARATEASPQRTAGTLDETVRRVEATGRRGLSIPTNLAVDDEVIAMVRTTQEHFGRLDILVNNAAITFVGDLDIPLKRYDLVMQVNLRAPLIAIREAAPLMAAGGGGTIINVSSEAALYPHPSLLAYGISKIGLERLTVDAAPAGPVPHLGELLPYRHRRRIGGVRGQYTGRRPLRLGAVRGGGRRHRLDGEPARRLLRTPREHARLAA
jgi:NAD(P)-dependent dehydrogenase (short-subunit alcohol dehydrogenase family)